MRKDIAEIRALKQEGHDVIDRIVRLGVNRSAVYVRLAERLQVSESGAHFQNIFTSRECRKAINALQQMEVERRAQIHENRKRRRAAAKARAKELKPTPPAQPAAKISWWRRILYKLTRRT